MKQWIRISFVVSMLVLAITPLCATVAPIVSGQSLWWIVKRIGLAVDAIESKVDLIDTSTTGVSCGVVELGQSSVMGGSLGISAAGSYCLKEDITADVTIGTSCVLLDMNGRCVTGTITVSSGSFSVIKNGFVNPPAPSGGATPAPGISVALGISKFFIDNVTVECVDSAVDTPGRDAIEVAGDDVQVRHSTFIAGAGGALGATSAGDGGSGIVLTTDASDVVVANSVLIGGDGGDSRGDGGHGIEIVGADNVVIEECTVFRAGMGGSSGGGGSAGDGGHGIAFITSVANNVFIKNCTIQKSGDGGNSASGAGGDGGHGIFIASVSNTKIAVSNCIISDTGAGGSGPGGFAPDGGNGVFIGASNADISVHNCTISNTGTAGDVAGKAVDDNVAAGANASKIYANFAHDIANATKFDLQASGVESGFALSNPPSSTAVSVYANVFI